LEKAEREREIELARRRKGYAYLDSISSCQGVELKSGYEAVFENLNALVEPTSNKQYDITYDQVKGELSQWSPNYADEAQLLKQKFTERPLEGIHTLHQMVKETKKSAVDGAHLLSLSDVEELLALPTEGPFEEQGHLIRDHLVQDVQELLASVAGHRCKIEENKDNREEKEKDLTSKIRDLSAKMFENKTFKPIEFKKRGDKALELIQRYQEWTNDKTEGNAMRILHEAEEKSAHRFREQQTQTMERMTLHHERALRASHVAQDLKSFAAAKQSHACEEEGKLDARRGTYASSAEDAVGVITKGMKALVSSLELRMEHEKKLRTLKIEAKAASNISLAWGSQWKSEEEAHINEEDRLKRGLELVERFHQWYKAFLIKLMQATENEEKAEQGRMSEFRRKMYTLVRALWKQLDNQKEATIESIGLLGQRRSQAFGEWRACMNTWYEEEEEEGDEETGNDDDATINGSMRESLKHMQVEEERTAKHKLNTVEMLIGKANDELIRLEEKIHACEKILKSNGFQTHEDLGKTQLEEAGAAQVEEGSEDDEQDHEWQREGREAMVEKEELDGNEFDVDAWVDSFFPEVPPTCAASRRVSQEHYRPSRRDSTATSVASSDIWGS